MNPRRLSHFAWKSVWGLCGRKSESHARLP